MVCDDFRNLAGVGSGRSEILYNSIVRAEAKDAWADLWPNLEAEGRVGEFFCCKLMFPHDAEGPPLQS